MNQKVYCSCGREVVYLLSEQGSTVFCSCGHENWIPDFDGGHPEGEPPLPPAPSNWYQTDHSDSEFADLYDLEPKNQDAPAVSLSNASIQRHVDQNREFQIPDSFGECGDDAQEEVILLELADPDDSIHSANTMKRFCMECDEWVMAVQEETRHSMHGLISFLLFLPWLLVWLLISIFPNYSCPKCKQITYSSDQFLLRLFDGRRVAFGLLVVSVLSVIVIVVREDQAIVLFDEGLELMENEQYEEALAKYDRVIELKSDIPEAYFNRAMIQMSLGRHDLAIDDLERSLDSVPDDFIASRELGRCYLILESYPQALRTLDNAVELSDEDAEALYLRAIANAKLGRRKKALGDIDQAIQIADPKTEEYADYLQLRYDLLAIDQIPFFGRSYGLF